MDASKRDSGRWSDLWHLLLTFPKLFYYCWLISSVFLARTSCHKITQTDDYYGAWPGWVISFNVLLLTALFSSFPQFFPASRSFPMSWLFTSCDQRIGTSALVSVLPMNIRGWFSLGLTDLISLQSKGLPRVFSSTTLQKHQFCVTQPSLWSNSHIHKWLLEKL